MQIAAPVATSLVLFTVLGLLRSEATPERDALLALVNQDGGGATVPAQGR
ncbi:hypothetical protein [Kitasatospora azatica]